MRNESELYRMRELPEDVPLAENFFDLVELYALNGPPTQASVYAKMIHSQDDERLFLENAKRTLSDPKEVKPIVEFYILFTWDEVGSYALRLPEILALAIAKGVQDYFDTSPALELYANQLARMLYNEGDGLAFTPEYVPTKEI